MSIENKTIDVELLKSFKLKDLLSGEIDLTIFKDCSKNSKFITELSTCIGELPVPFAKYVFESLHLPDSSLTFDSICSSIFLSAFAALKFCFDCCLRVFNGITDESFIDTEMLMTMLFANLFDEVSYNG